MFRFLEYLWIKRNLWPYRLTMFLGDPSWVFPVKNALPVQSFALISPLLLSTGCSVKPGFAPAGEALLFRQKDPKPMTPRPASLHEMDAGHGRASQLAALKQGSPDYESVHSEGRAAGVGPWETNSPASYERDRKYSVFRLARLYG